jgi:hypothetical protein
MAATVLLAPCLVILCGCATTHGLSASGPDTRAPIALPFKERERLRLGMRVYLESIEGIADGLQRNKMALVAKSARRSGMGMVEGVPLSDAIGLPPEFLMLSLDTHQKFDALADAAAGKAPKQSAEQQLSGILASCTACHRMYRLSPQ